MFNSANALAVTQHAIAQLTAKGYMTSTQVTLTALDDHQIVDMGVAIANMTNGTDLFVKALVGAMGKMIIDDRKYVAMLPKLFVDTYNWGAFCEAVQLGLDDVLIDEMWNPNGFVGGSTEGARIAAIEYGCYKPPVNVKIYEKMHGIMVPLTVSTESMFTAFKSADDYTRFLAGLYNSVETTLQAKAEVYALMTVSMGIATADGHGNAIKLVTEYNTATGSSLTQATALADPGFCKYMCQRIEEVKENMRRISTAYNDHTVVSFSAQPQLAMLTAASAAIRANVTASVYNGGIITPENYDTVPSWQAVHSTASDAAFNLATASSVSLTKDAYNATDPGTAATGAKTIAGVVAVLYDRYAMGIALDKKKVTSNYAASRDTTNYFHHAAVQYMVNPAYPIVTFQLA